MNSALYNDSYCIGLDELNKIYVSLLTSSDNVFINANTSINPRLSAEIQLHIKESIEDLEKAGLITYWCFPHDKDNHSHLNGNLVVLDRNEYDMWNSTINMHFFSGKRLESIFDAIGNHYMGPYYSLDAVYSLSGLFFVDSGAIWKRLRNFFSFGYECGILESQERSVVLCLRTVLTNFAESLLLSHRNTA